MVAQADLAGLVVVGADEQHAVDADLLRLAGQLDRVGGGVGADARDDARAVADRVLDRAQDLAVLGHRGGGALPRRAADDDAVVAVVDEVRRDPRGAVEVDAAVLVERGGHRGEEAAERDVGAHGRRLSPRSGMTASAEPGACRRSALRSRHGVRRGAGAADPRPARRGARRDVEEDVRRARLHGRRPHGGRGREPGLAHGAGRPGRRRGVGRRLVGRRRWRCAGGRWPGGCWWPPTRSPTTTSSSCGSTAASPSSGRCRPSERRPRPPRVAHPGPAGHDRVASPSATTRPTATTCSGSC